jgi:hypothetical protein
MAGPSRPRRAARACGACAHRALSAAVTAALALGADLETAVGAAKRWVTAAIAAGASGAGPESSTRALSGAGDAEERLMRPPAAPVPRWPGSAQRSVRAAGSSPSSSSPSPTRSASRRRSRAGSSTAGIVVLIDQVLRHARRVPVALVGALCLGAIAVVSYWARVAEPALRASPATRARIERLQFRYGLGVPGGSGTRRRVSG